MIAESLKAYLEKESAEYEILSAKYLKSKKPSKRQESPDNHKIAKVIIIKAGEKDVMVVIPEAVNIDLDKLGLLLDTDLLRLEDNDECAVLFPDCEQGAIPALGRPYNVPCFVDETLLDGAAVFFPGGKQAKGVKVSSDEYWRIAHAEIGNFRSRVSPSY